MRQSVIDRFVDFSSPLEGCTTSMYLDILGLVTVGIGCLCDPVQSALPLAWVLPDGSQPSAAVIAQQWRALKARQDLAKLHWKFAEPITTIRLTQQGVIDLAKQRLLANERILRTYFPAWDEWPADAQLFASSMAWAVGAGWPHIFGNCTRFLLAGDWQNAALCAAIRTAGNPGVVPRNAQNLLCLANARAVTEQHLDPEQLFWPAAAHGGDDVVANAASTELDRHAAQMAVDIADAAFAAYSGHAGSDGVAET